MFARNKPKSVSYIYPRIETRERASFEQSFDLRIVNHEMPNVCREVVLGKTPG
jgi:hypothetical protein